MNIFPQVNIPELTGAQSLDDAMGKSSLFDFALGDFVLENGRVVETDDITVWIEKIMRTEFGRYKIYEDTPYGIRKEDLIIGMNYSAAFAESELRREVEEALTQHPRITGITNFVLKRQPNDKTDVEFEVIEIDGKRNFTTTLGEDI